MVAWTVFVPQNAVSEASDAAKQKGSASLDQLFKKAAALETSCEYPAALAIYSTAIEESPQDARVHYRRGLAYFHSAQYKNAIDDLSKAIALNNQYKDAYFIRALALVESKQFMEALDDIQKVITADPQFREAFDLQIKAYEGLGEKDRAKELTEPSSKIPKRKQLAEGEPGLSDFSRYMPEVQTEIKKNWRPPSRYISNKIVAQFKVQRDGSLTDVKLTQPSEHSQANEAALQAIASVKAFKPLPPGAPSDIDVEFAFDYNVFGGSAMYGPTEAELLLQKARQAASKQKYERAVTLYIKALGEATVEEQEAVRKSLANAYAMLSTENRGNPAKQVSYLHKALYYYPHDEDSRKYLNDALKQLGANPESFQDRVSLGDKAQADGDNIGAVVEYLDALKIKDDPVVHEKIQQIKNKAVQ
jgi:TonB family protein